LSRSLTTGRIIERSISYSDFYLDCALKETLPSPRSLAAPTRTRAMHCNACDGVVWAHAKSIELARIIREPYSQCAVKM
jgi:hypothetical protein